MDTESEPVLNEEHPACRAGDPRAVEQDSGHPVRRLYVVLAIVTLVAGLSAVQDSYVGSVIEAKKIQSLGAYTLWCHAHFAMVAIAWCYVIVCVAELRMLARARWFWSRDSATSVLLVAAIFLSLCLRMEPDPTHIDGIPVLPGIGMSLDTVGGASMAAALYFFVLRRLAILRGVAGPEPVNEALGRTIILEVLLLTAVVIEIYAIWHFDEVANGYRTSARDMAISAGIGMSIIVLLPQAMMSFVMPGIRLSRYWKRLLMGLIPALVGVIPALFTQGSHVGS